MPELNERVAKVEAENGNFARDINKLEKAIEKVVEAVDVMKDSVTQEVAGLRHDISTIQQRRAKDVGFIAGISAAVSMVMGCFGLAVEFLSRNHP